MGRRCVEFSCWCMSQKIQFVFLSAVIICLIGYYIQLWTSNSRSQRCISGISESETKCRPVCGASEFSLYGMDSCRPWLNCRDVEQEVVKGQMLGQGAVKKVNLATWKGQHQIVWNELKYEYGFITDYLHGLEMLQELQSSRNFVTQIVGMCNDTVLTEYNTHGSAANIHKIFENSPTSVNIQKLRMELCVDYAAILNFLHHGNPEKTYVMCDSNDLEKTFGQYLLSDDLRLVLNDVDSLAVIHRSVSNKIKCGHRELTGDFVAPEQIWPYEGKEFSDEAMPPYDEKIDIWKIPDVCNYFLGSSDDVVSLKLQLLDIHMQCKNIDPARRPTSKDVYNYYSQIVDLSF